MPEIASNSALRVRHLRKSYKDVVAVDGLDLAVQAGECFGLLGPNGAGKTTTVEICEGLTARDSVAGYATLRKAHRIRNGSIVSKFLPARCGNLRSDRAGAVGRKTKIAC